MILEKANSWAPNGSEAGMLALKESPRVPPKQKPHGPFKTLKEQPLTVDNHSQHFEELTLSLSSAQVASLSSH